MFLPKRVFVKNSGPNLKSKKRTMILHRLADCHRSVGSPAAARAEPAEHRLRRRAAAHAWPADEWTADGTWVMRMMLMMTTMLMMLMTTTTMKMKMVKRQCQDQMDTGICQTAPAKQQQNRSVKSKFSCKKSTATSTDLNPIEFCTADRLQPGLQLQQSLHHVENTVEGR